MRATPIDTAKPGNDYRPDDQGSIFEALYTAASGMWKPEVNIDSQDNYAYTPDVAFMHGCPAVCATLGRCPRFRTSPSTWSGLPSA